jgi:hypothetical protein
MNLIKWWAALWMLSRKWLRRGESARAIPAVRPPERWPMASTRRVEWSETYGPIERIVTHDRPGEDRGMRLCRCSVCGMVRLCTPDFDFYARDPGGPLVCHNCFYVRVVGVRGRVIKL